MAITELVFPPLKADKHIRAEFYKNVPSSVRATFNVAGGPRASAVARVLESVPINAENHCGYLAVFSWESLDTVKNFLTTPDFAKFKASLTEYVDGPPMLQFFETPPGVAPEQTLQDSTHFFVIKAMGTEAQVSQAKRRWDEITATFSKIVGDEVKYHTGDGKQDYDGQFAGFSGWKSFAALNKALGQADIQNQLRALAEVGGSISTFTLELKHVF
ncbi:hypothetical protein ColLi_03614 [Colletotrichum liriopes]|uniref:Uncharacterized protein n=1 Tax=Colletotrichum liriopes TaxID=708192 RepID=A0AA37GGY7_9PEZI|nr:hypothetical protein ColLi_03614 [Colletotrichum liriopes]